MWSKENKLHESACIFILYDHVQVWLILSWGVCVRVRACVHALGTRVTSCGKRKQVADDKQTLAGEFFLLLPITL